MSEQAHPAPHRDRVGLGLLALVLIAVPCLWGLRLVVNYAIDSYFCFPDAVRHNILPGWAWPLLLALDLVCIAAAAAGVFISYRNWQITREEAAASGAPLVEIGEGRTRFLALWGLLIGIGFLVAMGFDLVGLWIVPACG